MVVGLTGVSCSGKNEVARIFSSLGYLVIDEDKLGHDALAVRKKEIVDAFGTSILSEDGSVDRRKLSSIVFSSPSMLSKLEGISHPYMVSETKRIMESFDGDVVINAAILEHLGLDAISDVFVFVSAPVDILLERAKRRNGTGREMFLKRLKAQEEIGKKLEASGKAIYRIENDSTLEELWKKTRSVVEMIRGGK